MFNVELNDDGVAMATELFGVTPVLVYTRWANYAGTCVWRCNQFSTYSLPGEPADERYAGLFSDGVFANTDLWNGPTQRLWNLLKERNPESHAKRTAVTKKAIEWDRETMFLHGAMVTGGKAVKDEQGNWDIQLPKDKPRKKILGIL